eukprot:6183764-Pleurochrysis_carterae.AAC.1
MSTSAAGRMIIVFCPYLVQELHPWLTVALLVRTSNTLLSSRYSTLSEKFAAREDVIVELRARMHEYESGVYGLREAVQETSKYQAQLAARDDEVSATALDARRGAVGESDRASGAV